jgi:cyclic pyranopterin phosphate synthase
MNTKATPLHGHKRAEIEPLFDGHGRRINDLRVSVTDLCNLRCQYCMPAEGVAWLDHGAILDFEEITRLVRVFISLGISTVRLTGGEPLVRRDFPKLAGMIGELGLDDLSITTNGFYLERDADALVRAGVRRFNVSLDALTRERYAAITRRDIFDRVLAGLRALEGIEGIGAIKTNAVAMRGFTETDVLAFAEFARKRPYQVRFIEFMPLGGGDEWQASDVLTGAEIRELIETRYPLIPVITDPHATARVYRFADGAGEIGFINPVSDPFCASCDRIRMTADGKLRTCLFSHYETDLRAPLRDGASDDDLRRVIRDAIWRKELKHQIGDRGFRKPDRPMSSIGG